MSNDFPALRDIRSKFQSDQNVYGLRRKIVQGAQGPVKIGIVFEREKKVIKKDFLEYFNTFNQ